MVRSSSSQAPQVQRREPSSSSSLKLISLMKRQASIFKKARELSTLCGIKVCVISYGPDGELKTYPKDREKVKEMARRYSELSDLKRRKGQVGIADSTNQKKKKKAKHVPRSKFPDWDPRFDNYSVEQLMNLMNSLEHNGTRIQTRFQDVVGQRNNTMQNMNRNMNMNMAYEEQRMMMPSTSTMNPFQHHPNQVSSMYLDIYGNSTQPRIQVPESGFNQAQSQSLPPLPPQLMNYPNPNGNSTQPRIQVPESGFNQAQSQSLPPLPPQLMNYPNPHGNSTQPQIQVPESGFNQAQSQSLPPLPPQLMNYPNPNSNAPYCSGLLEGQGSSMKRWFSDTNNMLPYNNRVDNQPGLLEPQGTAVNEFQNNMLPYSNRVDNQPGLLEAQGTSMNEFQNRNFTNITEEEYQWLLRKAAKGIELENMMNNMSNYNGNNTNINGVSHELPPLPSTTGFSTQPGHNTMLPYMN